MPNAGSVASGYGVRGLPTVMWIDRHGMLADVAIGTIGGSELKRRTEAIR